MRGTRRPRSLSLHRVAAAALFALSLGATDAAAQTPILGGGGHVYQVVTTPQPVTWIEAHLAAQAMSHNGWPGHLATVTTAEEEQFFLETPELSDAMNNHYYFGGYRASGSENPAHGWRWMTGEPWEFTNWAIGEPNNLNGVEACLQFWTDDGTLGRWNDNPLDFPAMGYVVEFSPPNVNCRSDWNGDGAVLPQDVTHFVAEWFGALTTGSLAGDFDFDRSVTPADLSLFVVTFFQNLNNGC